MEAQLTLRQPALAYQVLDILCSRISNNIYPPDSQLPTEWELAKEFAVSRATIRRAMDLLVERGMIYRRQGIGTFVSHPPDIQNPLHQFIDFREMLLGQGFRPGLVELRAALIDPHPKICEILELGPQQAVLETHKYFTADDELVVYCVNHIPLHVFESRLTINEVTQPGVMEPILEFYEKKCGQKIEYYTCAIRVEIVKHCRVAYLSQQLKPDTPVLIVDEVGYGVDNRPLHHSIEFHPGNHMQFGLIRLVDLTTGTQAADVRRRAMEKLNHRITMTNRSENMEKHPLSLNLSN